MSDLWVVTITTQMREKQMLQVGRHDVLGHIRARLIRKMAVPAHDPLLQAPRSTRMFLQHLWIMVGFQQQDVRAPNAFQDELGSVTEIRQKTDVAATRANQESNGILGIVRNRKRIHGNISNFKGAASVEHAKLRFQIVKGLDGFFGKAITINRHFDLRRQSDKASDMVRMLVGNKDAVQPLGRAGNGGKPLPNLASTETGINQQTSLVGLKVRTITGGTTSKDRELNRHGPRLTSQRLESKIKNEESAFKEKEVQEYAVAVVIADLATC
jgi:hypothetical protein